jgi:oligoribonuclease
MKRLLWLDLETTGLDPDEDHILMVAAARTDAEGAITESREWVVACDPWFLDRMPEVVKRMHTESGLLARVCSDEAKSLWTTVEHGLSEFIGADKPILAGNNIGFDRQFIMRWLPKVDAAMQYREGDVALLDVSMLRRAAQVWGLDPYPKEKKHLALDDIKASIAEFLFYRRAFGLQPCT